MNVRRVIGKAHLYLGMTVGAVFVLSALSGTALLHQDSLERWLFPQRFETSTGASLSLDTLVDTMAGGGAIALIELPREPQDPVVFFRGYAENWERIYMDPATGRILDTSTDSQDPLGILFILHTHLLAGETGEMVLGWIGLAVLLMLGAGVVLWWPGWARLAQGFTVKRQPGLRLWRDLHKLTGIVLLPLLVLQVLTGTALIFYAVSSTILTLLTQSAGPGAPATAEWNGRTDYSIDALLETAAAALPDAQPTWLELPQGPGQPLEVRLKLEEETHPNGRNFVFVDPADEAVLGVTHAFDTTATIRTLNALYPWHTGHFGGVVHKAINTIVGLAVVGLAVTGFGYWWARRSRRRSHRAEAAAAVH